MLKDVPNILGNFLQLQKDPNLQNDPQAAFDAAFAGSALGEPLRNIMKQFIPTSGNLVSAEQLVQNAKLESRNSSKEDKQPQKSTEENLASFYNVFNNDLVELLELIIKYRTKKFQDKIPEFRLLHLKLVETIAELKSLSLDKISKYANPVLDSIRKNQDTLKKYADELDSPHLWSQANLLLPETKVVPLNMLIGSIKSCKPDNEFRKLIREKMAQMYSRSQTIISLTDRYSGVAPIIGDVLNALENKEMQELDLNEIVSMVATPDTFNKVKNLSESVKDKSEEAMTDLLGAIVNAGTTTTNENKEKMKQKLTEFMQKGKEMANADAKEKELFYKQIMKDMQSFSTSVHEDEEQEDEEQEDVYDEKEDGKKAVEEKKTPTVSK